MNRRNSHTRPGLLAWLLLLLPATVRAGIDAPGWLSVEYVRNELESYESLEEIPAGTMLAADAYFSSNASSYGPDGVLVWAGFTTPGEQGRRYGILLLDIDLSRAPLDGQTPVPAGAWQASFLEKRGNEIVFSGRAVLGDVWVLDLFFSHGDDGALEADLALLFADDGGRFPGCRALLQGRLESDPSPSLLRQQRGLPPDSSDTVYVDTGCSGDVYLADDTGQGCACGGEDPDAGGCEGDTGGDSGCEGDTGGGSGCEGDTGGSAACAADSGGCGNTSGSGACSGSSSSNCSTAGRRRGPWRRFSRYLPQLLALLVLLVGRRRH